MHRPSATLRRATDAILRRTAVAVRFVCVAVLVFGGAAVAPPDSPGLTSATITIDGNFDDWIPVRADPDNVAFDTQVPDDPDWPGQPDRDIFYVNSTFDDEYLYFCWRRTAGGTKSITFGAYIDLGGDGLMNEGEDVVVCWTVADPTPITPQPQNYDDTGRILHYYQARSGGSLVYPDGDPMDHYGPPPTSMQTPPAPDWPTYLHAIPHGDGNTPDGHALGSPQYGESYPAATMDAFMDPVSGIEAEARIAWSDLGFSADQIPPRIAIHFVSGNGESYGSANKTSLWPDDYKSVSGKLQEQNRGQVEDNVRGLYWLTTAAVEIGPDRAGGGAPGSTIVYEYTVTNHGNSDDTYDLSAASSRGWPIEVVDSGGNPIDEIALSSGSSATVYLRVTIPDGTAVGTRDTTTLTATSQSTPSITDAATAQTTAGLITLTPDRSGSMAPGETIEYTYTLANHMATTRTLDLTTASTLGFATQIVDAGGTPISSATLAPGEEMEVTVRVTVPPGATIGSQDVMTLTARDQADPTLRASARGTTTVLAGLDIDPDRTGYGGVGTWVQYEHTITNSWPTTRTIDVGAVSSAGWDVKVYGADGITEITQITVGPYGASETVIVRTRVPSTATNGTTDTLTVTASTGATSDSVTDTTIVRMLDTYADAGYINAQRDFYLTEMMYARATGLSPGSEVYFVWRDSDGQVVRTSTNRRVDTQGMAFDEYTSTADDATGAWTVELYTSGGTLLATSPLVLYWNAEITALSANDASSIGDDVTVSSAVTNRIDRALDDTSVEYVIWWDSDGDGLFGAGDIYIDATGAPVIWDGVSAVPPTHVATDVDVAPLGTLSLPEWSVSNAQFPNQGTYKLTATWLESDGVRVIDEKTTDFYSIPTLGWPLFLLLVGGVVAAMWRRLRVATTPLVERGGEAP